MKMKNDMKMKNVKDEMKMKSYEGCMMLWKYAVKLMVLQVT